jgi:hypothetical protein
MRMWIRRAKLVMFRTCRGMRQHGSRGWGGCGSTITDVSPSSGPPTGGNTVTITGSYLSTAQEEPIEGVAARRFTVISDSEVTAVVPQSGGDETANVVVCNAEGQHRHPGRSLHLHMSPKAGPCRPSACTVIPG